jgi:hypothetical protein
MRIKERRTKSHNSRYTPVSASVNAGGTTIARNIGVNNFWAEPDIFQKILPGASLFSFARKNKDAIY